MPGVTIRRVRGDSDADAFAHQVWRGFGEHPDEDGLAAARSFLDGARALLAWDGAQAVGSALWFPTALSAPGGRDLPASALTDVTVLPTHRRRGLLRRLMDDHLRDARDGGAAVSVLLASEAPIYGRFGYGPATTTVDYVLDRAHAVLVPDAPPPDGVRIVPRDVAAASLPDLHEATRRRGAGDIRRDPMWWRFDMSELIPRRMGKPQRFYALMRDRRGRAVAAAWYRIQPGGDPSSLTVGDVLARDDAAERSMWRYLLGVDLVGRIRLQGPLDHPLRHMLADPRRLVAEGAADGLWVRVLDVPAALAGRGYAAEGAAVVQVDDPLLDGVGGRFALEAGPDGAACTRTRRRPDVVMGVSALGAVLLGGVSVAALVRAGRAEAGRRKGPARLDALLAAAPMPYLATGF